MEPLAVSKLTTPLETAFPEISATLAVKTDCFAPFRTSRDAETWVRVVTCPHAPAPVEIIHAANAKPTVLIAVRVRLPRLNHCKFILRILCSLSKTSRHTLRLRPENHCI